LSESSIGLPAHLNGDVKQTRDDPGLNQNRQGCQADEYRQKILIDHDVLQRSFTLTAVLFLSGFDRFIDALFPALDKAANGRTSAAPFLHILSAFLNLFRDQIHTAMSLRRQVVPQFVPGFWSEQNSNNGAYSGPCDEIKESFIGGHDEVLLPIVDFS
jgi:hypothetical protein